MEIGLGIFRLLATLIGLGFAYVQWRTKELRKDEILEWSQECIDVLQRTYLLVSAAAQGKIQPSYDVMLTEMRFRSSVQTERGRMFFLNVKDSWGSDKPKAYQGLRPVILDCLVANFQICELAQDPNGSDLFALEQLSLSNTRRFVSYAQEEVGRSKLSKSAAEGTGFHVDVTRDMHEYQPGPPLRY
jgi:hypothetical protein